MDDTLETFVPMTFRRRGARRVAADDRHVHDVTLLEGVARGFYWQHLVDTGVMKSGSDIARAEGLHPSVPNELMREFHDRMPVILEPYDYGAWLDPTCEDADAVAALCRSLPSERMQHWAVSPWVNSPKRDDVECLRRSEVRRLFD